MPLVVDAIKILLKHDGNIPDWEKAMRYIACGPGVACVERLKAPEKQGLLYTPTRAAHTYHDENDDPVAGFEPSLGCVLSSGIGCWLKPGMIVVMYDGDGLEIEEFIAGDYKSSGPVTFFGRVVPDGKDMTDPGYIEDLPWEESLVAVVEGMDIKQMTGRNVLIERDEDDLSRMTDSGIHLPDIVSENAASEGVIKMVGELVEGCEPGNRVVYHPLATLDFYDPENKRLRIVRESAILAVIG